MQDNRAKNHDSDQSQKPRILEDKERPQLTASLVG